MHQADEVVDVLERMRTEARETSRLQATEVLRRALVAVEEDRQAQVAEAIRMSKRDARRVNEAYDRSVSLQRCKESFPLSLEAEGFEGSDEIRDLLAYLCDHIWHDKATHGDRVDTGEYFMPLVHHESSWHVSPQKYGWVVDRMTDDDRARDVLAHFYDMTDSEGQDLCLDMSPSKKQRFI